MTVVAFEKVVEFTVDVLMPMLPSASGVDAIRGGEWCFSPGNPRTDPMPEPDPVRNEVSIGVFNKIFSELAKNDAVPKFRDFMNEDDYKRFVEAYCIFVRDTDLRLRGTSDYFLDPILTRFQGDDYRSCWVPRPYWSIQNDMRMSRRKQFREIYRKKLKEMCVDSALLAPYYIGSIEDCENGHLQSEGVRLFLAAECIVVVKSGFSIDYSDKEFANRECVSWLGKGEHFYRFAKKRIADGFASGRLFVVNESQFDKLFVDNEVGSLRESRVELSFGEPNLKGWYVRPWKEHVEGDAKKAVKKFRKRKCSEVVHDALLVFWRGNQDVPNRSSLRDYWFSLLDEKSSTSSLKRDPDNEGLLYIFDIRAKRYINEADVDIEEIVERFVSQPILFGS